MDNAPSEISRRPLFHSWPWLVVLLVLLFVSFVRFRLLDVPLERDEGEYAYAGQLLLQGIPPYQLAWNMKLPGTYFVYALGMALFGQSIPGIHLTLLLANTATIVFVFLLARKLIGTTAGLAACAAFGILSASPGVLGLAAHANHFVILFAVPATLLLCKAEESNRLGILFGSGLLYGLAFLMKQQGVCFCLFAVAVLAGNAIQNRTIPGAAFFRKSLWLVLGMLLPFVLTCLFLYRAGVFSSFWFWTFTYARSYATELSLYEGLAKFIGYLNRKWPVYFPFLILIAAALPYIVRNRAFRKPALFTGAFLLFSFLGTAIDLNFREHYFILLLPALAVMFGLAVAVLQDAAGKNKMVPAILCVAVLGWSVFQQRRFFLQLPANVVSAVIYSVDVQFTAMPFVGAWLQDHSTTNDTVAVAGSEPEIYFYSHRHSATGYIYMYPMMEPQPYASQMQHDMIAKIEATRPEFLLYVANQNSWTPRPASDLTVFQWFKSYAAANYQEAAVVDQADWNKAVFVQGAALANFQITNANYIIIFKRNSAPQ